MKKRILALLLAVVMLFTLAACGGEDKSADPNLIEIGDCQALYTGAWITKDYDGDDAIVIPFTFTNNSDENKSFMWALFYTVMQDGVELEVCSIFESEDSYDTLSDDIFTEIAPGKSIDLNLTYKLNDLENEVVLEFSDLMDKKKDQLTIDVTTLKTETAPDQKPEKTEKSEVETETETNSGAVDINSPVTFKLVSATAGGEELPAEILEMMGASYIVFNGDGTGTFAVFGDVFPITYDETAFASPDGETMDYTLTDNGISITLDGDELVFEVTDETPDLTVPETEEYEEEAVQVGYAFDTDIVENYTGDWHGMAEFYDCTGDYSEIDDTQCEIVARFSYDEDGYCTPYIRLCLSDDESENLMVESLDYDEEYNCMLINGTLANQPLDPVESFVEVLDGVMYIGAMYDDGSGDVFNVLGCLRKLDDTAWDYEEDYPYLAEDALEFYAGMSLEEIVELYGYDVSLIPGSEYTVPATGDEEPVEEETAGEEGGTVGIVTLQQLIDWKAWLDETSCYETEYYKPTLEECMLAMGAEPLEWKLDEWNEENIFVKWMTEDEKEHIILTLRPTEDGEDWQYHAASWTGGVNG